VTRLPQAGTYTPTPAAFGTLTEGYDEVYDIVCLPMVSGLQPAPYRAS
jgi:hypothetical protein